MPAYKQLARAVRLTTILGFTLVISSYLVAEVYSWLVFQGVIFRISTSVQTPSAGNTPLSALYVYDEQLGYRLDTHSEGDSDHVRYANTLYTVKKGKDVYRIVCVGGSTTIGIDNPKFSYPAILQDMFDFALKNCAKKVEVINAGAMGYNSWHTKLRADRELDRLQPDLYVVMDGTNDVLASAAIENVEEAVRQRNVLTRQINLGHQQKKGAEDLFRHDPSLLFDALDGVDLVRRIRTEADRFFADDIFDQKVKAFGFEQNVEEFIRGRERKGIPVMLVNYGWIVRDGADGSRDALKLPYKFNVPLFQFGRRYVRATLAEISRKFGTPFVDIQPWTDALLHRFPMTYRIFNDELHYTQFFNYFLAREVFDKLRGLGELKIALHGCSLPEQKAMDDAFAYCVGWGEYYSGFGLPAKISSPVALQKVSMEGTEMSGETYDNGNGEKYSILRPIDREKPGIIRFTLHTSECRGFMEYYPRMFSNHGMVVVECLSDGGWRKVSEFVAYKDSGEWTPIGNRYFFACPEGGGSVQMRITLTGSVQLFMEGEGFLFRRR